MPYPVSDKRHALAEAVVTRILPTLSEEDVLGILGEVGLWECCEEEDDEGRLRLKFSRLQMVAAAAALAAASEGLDLEAIQTLDD